MSKCQYCKETNPNQFYLLNSRTCKACILKRNRGYRKEKKSKEYPEVINESPKVVCQLCGTRLLRINWFHLRTHGITPSEYHSMFPDAPMYSLVWTENLRKVHLGKPSWNKGKTWKDDGNYVRYLWRQQFNHIGQVAWNKGKTKEDDLRVAKSANTMKNHIRTEEHCRAISEAKKGKLYPNLIYFLKPNKSELRLRKLLDVYFPDEWVFTGDGKFILDGRSFEVDGKLPDFLNVKTRNHLIEFCGEYWHRDDNPQERADCFRQFGFETLIIWGKELKNENILIARVKAFMQAKTLTKSK